MGVQGAEPRPTRSPRWRRCSAAPIRTGSRRRPRPRRGSGSGSSTGSPAERRAERRRPSRVKLALAAAAVAAVGAVVAVLVTSTGSDQSTRAETVAFRSLPRGVFAEATLAPRPWGSEVSVKVYGFRPGALCQVWLRSSSGKRVPAGSFRYVYDGEGEHLSSALPPSDATAIGLRAGSKTYVAPLPHRAAVPRSRCARVKPPRRRPRRPVRHASRR